MILRALTRKLRSPKRLLSLAIEPLEQKQMLSGTAPTVANVAVGSTAWASGFVSYLQSHGLGNGGYSIPVGSSAQTLALPWNNLNQIQIKFSKDVKVEKSDLSVTGANVSQYDFANFSYDSATFTATWTLSQNIGADKVLLTLSGANLDPVVDSNGNILDGEWVDGTSTQSGNGTAGGDFAFRFNVLPGDVNQSTLVTTMDYANVAVLLNTNTSSPTYNPLRDVDGSGTINSTDQSLVSGKIGAALPTNNPSSNHAPTAQGVVNVEVNEDAADQAISLWDNFQDPTDSDSQLTYTVISNSNSSLVTSTSIDSTHGNLNLSFAANANGNADIVVRATDTGGLHVDSTVHVHVTPVDDAPVISNFNAVSHIFNTWIFTGTVSDVDDNVEGMIVHFYGVLDGLGLTATVQADGSFSLVYDLDPYTFGTTWVQTADASGTLSNTASDFIGVT